MRLPLPGAKPERRGVLAWAPRFRLVGLLPAAAMLAPLSILAGVGWLSWRAVWDDAQTDMLRAAGSAAEYGERTLESYTLAAGRVNDRLRGLSDAEIRRDEASLQRELQKISAELTQSELTYVVDRDGYTLLASNLFPAPRQASVRDSDYFRAMSGPAPAPSYVSRTFPFEGRPLFSVSRLRRDTGNPPAPNGFEGIVLVSVSPHVLANGIRRLLPAPTDRIALMRADGYGISTTGGLIDPSQPLPRVDPSSPFYTFAGEGAPSAVYVSSTAAPGSSVLLAMRRIEGFPIYAVSLRPTAEIVARWRAIMTTHLAFGIPATLALLLLSLRVWRDQRRLAASHAALRRDNDLTSDRLFRTKRFGLVGTFEFDPRTGTSRRSAEYMSVHGLPPVATEEAHDAWLKRLHPDDREGAERELRDALSDPSASDYAQTYRIVTPRGDIRWIAARGEIARDAAGSATMMLGAHVDVTPARATELALAASDARLRLAQEAVGIGAWEWQVGTRSLQCSPRILELLERKSADGTLSLDAFLDRVHPDDRSLLRALLRRSRRDGGAGAEFRVLSPAREVEPEAVWLAARAKLVKAPDSPRPRLMGIAYDITESKRAADLTALMAHEVEHRAKNVLAVVLSLLRMSKADSAADLARIMDGRVRALSQTISLLGQRRWTGADLGDILGSELAPYRAPGDGDGFDIALSGPPVTVDPNTAQALSMALHELATNAAKYGALSAPGGRLHVEWRIEGERVHLAWRERGGPPLDGSPPRSGFGSRLIRSLFEGQIGGAMTKRWEPDGLVCEMSFAIQSAATRREPDALASASAPESPSGLARETAGKSA